jgi:hypothetical protein
MASPESARIPSFGLIIRNTRKAITRELSMSSSGKVASASDVASRVRGHLGILANECPKPEEPIILAEYDLQTRLIRTVYDPFQNEMYNEIYSPSSETPHTLRKANDETIIEMALTVCNQYRIAEADRNSPILYTVNEPK